MDLRSDKRRFGRYVGDGRLIAEMSTTRAASIMSSGYSRSLHHRPSALKIASAAALAYGLDARRVRESIRNIPRYVATLRAYQHAQGRVGGMPVSLRSMQPHLADIREAAGNFDAEYLYQDWWVAREVHRRQPVRHVDIGSRLDGFVSHLLVFRAVEFVDVRPIALSIDGFTGVQQDARSMSAFEDGSVDSVSCLHALEHVGLGRYGDPVDPLGSAAVAREICRIVSPGGRAYVSMPVGQERLEFNGQRVFAPGSVLGMFDQLDLEKFSAVDDDGVFHEEESPSTYVGARDACGIFVFRKPGAWNGE